MTTKDGLTREGLLTHISAALDIDGRTAGPHSVSLTENDADLARLVAAFNRATGWVLDPAAGTLMGAPDSLSEEVLSDLLHAAAENATS